MPVPVGYKHTEEAKRRISLSKLGKKRSPFSKEWRKNIGLAHTGLKSPLKGRKISEETREKIRTTQKARYLSGEMYIPYAKGRKATEEQRRKLSKALKGKKRPSVEGANNANWKGGVTPKHRRIRNSIEYREWRAVIFERNDYTCQLCLVRGGDLEADHIKPFSVYPELRFKLSNGRTLCIPCHRKTPTYGYRAAR